MAATSFVEHCFWCFPHSVFSDFKTNTTMTVLICPFDRWGEWVSKRASMGQNMDISSQGFLASEAELHKLMCGFWPQGSEEVLRNKGEVSLTQVKMFVPTWELTQCHAGKGESASGWGKLGGVVNWDETVRAEHEQWADVGKQWVC